MTTELPFHMESLRGPIPHYAHPCSLATVAHAFGFFSHPRLDIDRKVVVESNKKIIIFKRGRMETCQVCLAI